VTDRLASRRDRKRRAPRAPLERLSREKQLGGKR
jgi:hypothetical protein